MPTLLSIQVGRIAPLGPRGTPSAFVKTPVSTPTRIHPLGLEGDQQADLNVHGGRDNAVYFYPAEHYTAWLAEYPHHAPLLTPGGFGENLTTTGLNEDTVSLGDTFAIGTAVLQVTHPRQPCFKLALRFADKTLGKRMLQTSRTGWYTQVLTPGTVTPNDNIQTLSRPHPAWTITRFNDLLRTKSPTRQDLTTLLEIDSLPTQWREHFHDRLADLDASE